MSQMWTRAAVECLHVETLPPLEHPDSSNRPQHRARRPQRLGCSNSPPAPTFFQGEKICAAKNLRCANFYNFSPWRFPGGKSDFSRGKSFSKVAKNDSNKHLSREPPLGDPRTPKQKQIGEAGGKRRRARRRPTSSLQWLRRRWVHN